MHSSITCSFSAFLSLSTRTSLSFLLPLSPAHPWPSPSSVYPSPFPLLHFVPCLLLLQPLPLLLFCLQFLPYLPVLHLLLYLFLASSFANLCLSFTFASNFSLPPSPLPPSPICLLPTSSPISASPCPVPLISPLHPSLSPMSPWLLLLHHSLSLSSFSLDFFLFCIFLLSHASISFIIFCLSSSTTPPPKPPSPLPSFVSAPQPLSSSPPQHTSPPPPLAFLLFVLFCISSLALLSFAFQLHLPSFTYPP